MNACQLLVYLDSDIVLAPSPKGTITFFKIKLLEKNPCGYYLYASAVNGAADFLQKNCKIGDLMLIFGTLAYDRLGNLYIQISRVRLINSSTTVDNDDKAIDSKSVLARPPVDYR